MLLLNGKEVPVVHYPNGETLIKPDMDAIDPSGTGEDIEVTLYFESDADLLQLWMLNEHLDADSDSPWATHKSVLKIPYMPYSRADRSENGSVFSLKHVCHLINLMIYDEVIVYEPHSDVTLQYLKRAETRNTTVTLLPRVMNAIEFRREVDYLVLPDKGALDRYTGQSTIFKAYNTIHADKVRDFETGKILSIEFNDYNGTPAEGAKALIVDDLCSAGGTFSWTSNILREMGFAQVHLLVTHFEKIGYNKKLFDSLDSIHTTDSMLPPASIDTVPDLKKINFYFLEDIDTDD